MDTWCDYTHNSSVFGFNNINSFTNLLEIKNKTKTQNQSTNSKKRCFPEDKNAFKRAF